MMRFQIKLPIEVTKTWCIKCIKCTMFLLTYIVIINILSFHFRQAGVEGVGGAVNIHLPTSFSARLSMAGASI